MTEPDIERIKFDARRIRIILPPRHVSGIDTVIDAVRHAFERAGCGQCGSGLDIELTHDRVVLVNPESKEYVANFEAVQTR